MFAQLQKPPSSLVAQTIVTPDWPEEKQEACFKLPRQRSFITFVLINLLLAESVPNSL